MPEGAGYPGEGVQEVRFGSAQARLLKMLIEMMKETAPGIMRDMGRRSMPNYRKPGAGEGTAGPGRARLRRKEREEDVVSFKDLLDHVRYNVSRDDWRYAFREMKPVLQGVREARGNPWYVSSKNPHSFSARVRHRMADAAEEAAAYPGVVGRGALANAEALRQMGGAYERFVEELVLRGDEEALREELEREEKREMEHYYDSIRDRVASASGRHPGEYDDFVGRRAWRDY